MPELRVLSGKEVIKIFQNCGFEVVNQRGSHVKLRRITKDKPKETLTIPNHAEMDKGTLKAIYNQALRYVSGEDLQKHFYL